MITKSTDLPRGVTTNKQNQCKQKYPEKWYGNKTEIVNVADSTRRSETIGECVTKGRCTSKLLQVIIVSCQKKSNPSKRLDDSERTINTLAESDSRYKNQRKCDDSYVPTQIAGWESIVEDKPFTSNYVRKWVTKVSVVKGTKCGDRR